ncbi:MAG: PrsW family intramembrane metalloprotease [Patescibacteria group bacterium]
MFEGFTQDDWIQLGAMVLLAATPAVIWSVVLFKGRKTSRWPLLLAFFLGTLTVLPLILIYDYLWVKFPQLNVYNAIDSNITEVHIAAIASLVVVGILEELAKSGVVRFIGKTRIGIQTINDAVKYSILAGLGFAFTENIFYFRDAWQQGGVIGLLPVMIFRSLFTVCAHMVFSGIYGYFYGISKFAHPIMEASLWMGERSFGVRMMSKILGTDEAKAYSQLMLMKGLFIAMAIHAAFNSLLEFNQFFPVIAIVGLGFMYLLYLLAHKAGAIVFASTGQNSSMAKKDVDTVLQLLGMWTKEGRHKDVIDICQRLLLRDPDNKVVQLFQAKAMDNQKLTDLESSFTSLFQSEDKTMTDTSLRTLVKQKVLMEMLKEKQIAAPAPSPVPTPASDLPKIPRVPGLESPQSGPSSPQGNP